MLEEHRRRSRPKVVSMRNLRVVAVTILCLAIVAVMAPGAAAESNPHSGRFLLAPQDGLLTGVCPFPVLIETISSNAYLKFLPDGTILITGTVVQRLTNTVTGTSKVYNASGPAQVTVTPSIEYQTLLGHTLTDAPSVGLIFVTGRVERTYNYETGAQTIISIEGQVEDVCATLAA
jgi:hypothetical protein